MFTVCSTAFASLGRSQARVFGFPHLPMLVVPHPFGGCSQTEIDEIAASCVEQIVKFMDESAARDDGATISAPFAETSGDAARKSLAVAFEVDDDVEAINHLYQTRRWSDGLPIVPPTLARVERMLAHAGRSRSEVVARIAPKFAAATVERIAINAVLAGCLPQLMPTLIAAAEAMAEPAFNLQAVQTTTNPVAVWVILNGPMATELGFNAKGNCLGEGTAANATAGRAIRLMMRNIGGALPGQLDAATQGQPGRYSFCCAENEEDSPWTALHVDRGFNVTDSTVTVVAAEGTMNMNTHTKDADELMRAIAETMMHPPSNEYHLGGEPWLMLGPEHAQILARAGYSKDEVKRRLWELSKMPASKLTQRDFERARWLRKQELGDIQAETPLPIAPRPGDINIIVAGGAGTHSTYLPSFGISLATTRLIHCATTRENQAVVKK